MSKIDAIREFIKEKAEQFGAKTDAEFNKPYVPRNNTGQDALKDNGAYFGFIHPDEDISGPFHDFSLTIFPTDQDNKAWLVCLGVGSLGFKNDYELATFPGLRRLFSKLVDDGGFCKSDFSDLENSLPKGFSAHPELQHIKKSIQKYTKVLPACQIVKDPTSDAGKQVISAFIAGYAKLRDWPSNKDHRKAVSDALSVLRTAEPISEITEILNLVKERKYIILQGPPGTGKTRAAKLMADELKAKTFFTQFHAETTYSDFIYGIRPSLDTDNLSYKENLGVFTQALKYAKANSDKKTLLIIDEINRANLSNVLGPIFYLFEYKQDTSGVEIEITPDLSIDKMPEEYN